MPDPQNDGVFFNPVVIDDRFNSYNVKDLIKDRTRFEHVGQPDTPADPDLPELPLTRDGKLAPGVLYDSTKDPNVKYSLPEYVLRVENTLYRIRLRFRNVDEDPEGPIAFLIVELIASAPQDHRFTLKEIEHDAIVRLAYQVSVSDEESDPVPPSTGIDDFVGDGPGDGSAIFQVWGDGVLLASSSRLTGADDAEVLSVDIEGVDELVLITTTGGDSDYKDHTNWADAKLFSDVVIT